MVDLSQFRESSSHPARGDVGAAGALAQEELQLSRWGGVVGLAGTVMLLGAIESSWYGAQSVFDTMLATGVLLVPIGR
jgi:hypothetical protein